MKEYQLVQTPKKEHHQYTNRRSKSISEQTKKLQKISKKCLDSVFTSVSEDLSLESPKHLIEFSPISEDNQLTESAESFIGSPNEVSDVTPLSSVITTDKDVGGDDSFRSVESKNSVEISSVETEIVVNHLKQARIQVMNSANADLQSKKLLDALIEVVIMEFNALSEEKDRFSELVSLKTRVVFLSFFLWIIAVSVVLIFSSGVQSSFSEPPPT